MTIPMNSCLMSARHSSIITVSLLLLFSTCHRATIARQVSAFTVIAPPTPSQSSHRRTRCYSSTKSAKSLLALSATKQSSSLCSVDLIDPETGCEVTLVGCFHGSQSSASDVEYALTHKPTDVVVLELCAERFDDLRKEFEQEMIQERQGKNEKNRNNGPWLMRYAQMVMKTCQTKGLSTGAAVAVLGGVSGMQTALSGLQPGLEFTTALRIARGSVCSDTTPPSSSTGRRSDETTTIRNQESGGMDIVLADQSVDVTLYKLGKLPQVAVGLWKDCLRSGWQTSFGKEANALKTALMGVDGNHKYVRLPSFLTRSDAAIRDLLRLTIPPLAIVQTFSVAVSSAVAAIMPYVLASNSDYLNDAIINNSAFMSTSAIRDDPIFLIVANALFVMMVYVSVVLPAARVVLSERDDQLTNGIREACRIASAHQPDGKGGRVVAVLGLLHVNGIAQRMLVPSSSSPSTSVEQS